MKGRPTSWYLAIFVALALPITVFLSAPHHRGFSWPWLSVISGYVLGTALIFWGTVRWYGKRAQRLRQTGFFVTLALSIFSVFTFFFLLLPFLLLGAFSLSRHKRDEQQRTSSLGVFAVSAMGAIWFLISTSSVPWYTWHYGSADISVSPWNADALLTLLIFAVFLGGIASLLVPGSLGRLLALAASFLALILIFFRIIVPPVGPGVISAGISAGVIMGLEGSVILVLGAVINKLRASL